MKFCEPPGEGAAAATEQATFVREPLKAPSVQVRVSETHCEPAGTDEDWYAVTVEPLATVLPLNVHEAGAGAAATVHAAFAYVPESVPFEHVRCSETHEDPAVTDGDWYAVTTAAWATDEPLNVQDCGDALVHEEFAYEPLKVPF